MCLSVVVYFYGRVYAPGCAGNRENSRKRFEKTATNLDVPRTTKSQHIHTHIRIGTQSQARRTHMQ